MLPGPVALTFPGAEPGRPGLKPPVGFPILYLLCCLIRIATSEFIIPPAPFGCPLYIGGIGPPPGGTDTPGGILLLPIGFAPLGKLEFAVLLICAFGPPIWVVFVTLLFKPDIFDTLEFMDDDIADVEEFIDEFNELVALADDTEELMDVDSAEAADDIEEDDDDGKLFGNEDDNEFDDEEGKFDVDTGWPVDEIGIVPPGGPDPVLFGRPAPTGLLLILFVGLFPAVFIGIAVLALIVGEELDCGKGIVGRFGIFPIF